MLSRFPLYFEGFFGVYLPLYDMTYKYLVVTLFMEREKMPTGSRSPLNLRKPTQDTAKVTSGVAKQSAKNNGSKRKRLASPEMLAYPVDTADVEQGHYVIFQIHQISNGKLTKVTNSSGFAKRSFALKGASKSVATQIALYMPPSVSVKYKANYEDKEIGATAEGIVNSIGEFNASSGWGAAGGAAMGAINVGANVAKKATSAAIGGAAEAAAPGLADALSMSAGKIVTKKMEMIFQGVGRRQFTFEFAFIPKSFKEAQQVDKIVQAFKLAMLPKYTESFGIGLGTVVGAGDAIGAGGEGRTLSIPTTMDIKYFFNTEDGSQLENEYINRISTCYLADLEVKYGGDRYTAYTPQAGDKGAPPQNTSITMTFDEIEIITQEAAAQGF